MAGTDAQRPERDDADTTVFGLPDRAMPRTPSYVKTVTAPPDEATGHRRRSRADQDIPRESLAERMARNRQGEEPRISRAHHSFTRSQFTFTNSHWTPIYVAFTGWDEACERDCGSGENVTGWFEIAPAETQTFPNPSGERRIYYYAEATDGSVYDGSFFHALVMDVQFRVCFCHKHHIPSGQTPWYEVGFDELDLGAWSGVTFF